MGKAGSCQRLAIHAAVHDSQRAQGLDQIQC